MDKGIFLLKKKCQKCDKIKNIYINFLEFGECIWNHREKCIQISTNIPGIGSEMLRILRNKNDFVWMMKPMACKVSCKVLYENMHHFGHGHC